MLFKTELHFDYLSSIFFVNPFDRWDLTPLFFAEGASCDESIKEESMSDNHANLIGIWKMVSFDIEDKESGERKPFYGDKSPNGYMILADEGRMMVLVTSGDREPGQTDEKQAALFRTMLSYTGVYRFEHDKFVTRVDVSWNESWTGTDQVRFYKLDGDRLDILTAWMSNPIDPERRVARAILSWERAK